VDFIISDTHFNHGNILKYVKRPFSSVKEMDDEIVLRWNENVSKKDRVFLLGDVMFSRKIDEILTQLNLLNGKIIIVLGNHDKTLYDFYIKGNLNNPNKKIFIASPIFEPKVLIKGFKDYQKVVLCHYPIYSWNAKLHGRLHFYGHVHSNTITDLKNAYNVSSDVLNFTPTTFDEVIKNVDNSKII
jgi:calcineurin-like phosphoesterase family protein